MGIRYVSLWLQLVPEMASEASAINKKHAYLGFASIFR